MGSLKRLKDLGSDRSGRIRLDKNERTVPFPEEVFRAMLATLRSEDLPAYPDQGPLYRKLARSLGVDERCLLLTSGSDAALKAVFETYVEPGQEVVFLDPTYAMIDVYSDLFGARKTKVGYSQDLELDFPGLLDSVRPGTRVVFVANPNQPTGTVLAPGQAEALLRRAASMDTLVVFDEAYVDFADAPSLLDRIADFPNLVVTRTFSKGFGLASARLGYVASAPENIDFLYRVKPLADVNLLALRLGEYLLDHPGVAAGYVRDVAEGRRLLEAELPRLGVRLVPSQANFIHLRLPEGAGLARVADELGARGYLVRISGRGLPAVLEGCIRITLGPPDQMRGLLEALREVLPREAAAAPQ